MLQSTIQTTFFTIVLLLLQFSVLSMVWHVNQNIQVNQNQLSNLVVVLKIPFYYKQKYHLNTLTPYNNKVLQEIRKQFYIKVNFTICG